MQQYYSKKVMDHFLHPRNLGKMKDASGVGDTQNMRCGDVMKMYIKIKKAGKKDIIENVKFETFGCGHAIAISDMMCELIKGKAIEKALKIGYEDITKELGFIPPAKVHCSYLAKSALKAAIDDYKARLKI
ncbi:MAG: iron-sulfur cluster assembly scaffold protein [Candidatus Nealsonbacteria bacterium]|nr:iron-sulfur cluster assembly scaffold protein [Candidatus Nealsonbacteria bacterium]